jgi:hypothetical protein
VGGSGKAKYLGTEKKLATKTNTVTETETRTEVERERRQKDTNVCVCVCARARVSLSLSLSLSPQATCKLVSSNLQVYLAKQGEEVVERTRPVETRPLAAMAATHIPRLLHQTPPLAAV